ncbi:MAG TPA: ATP-binding protein [Polyangia bacterium]|nr:ATP-binding protein [Polyangia bacterium]
MNLTAGPSGALAARVLAGAGEAAAIARAVDWSKTALGPVAGWSQALRSAAALVLHNHSGMLLWWGPEMIQIYNDAYRPVLGDKHPRAMGQPLRECWSEVFHIVGPMAERPLQGGPASTSDDLPLLINRKVHREETHFRLAYSPVPDHTVRSTGVGGVLATVTEITEETYGARQIRTLRELGARAALDTESAERACVAAAVALGENRWDVPFALIYLLDADGKRARLAAGAGFDPEDLRGAAGDDVDLTAAAADRWTWPLREVVRDRREVIVGDLAACPFALPRSPWSDHPRAAIALPLASPDQPGAYGVLVCGVSPHRVLDAGYRAFFELAAGQVVTAVRNARALEQERRRAEALAEVDRAKTAFFSNVSHEFRTPLTLMLGPEQDALATPGGALGGEELRAVHRNTLRLLKLVNSLLEFSRIEAGRARASYRPTDLGTFTRDLASSFRAAIERAGLRFEVDCPPLPEPVYVDREMWERIVLNLLSNAFKFTFEGAISVVQRQAGGSLVLEVSDSGVGIPERELPHVFERFHRIEGTQARTHEGSGIGLALVRDTVALHGGKVAVESRPGAGSKFTVSLPLGTAHLPADRIAAAPDLTATPASAESYVAEAARWLPETAPGDAPAEEAAADPDDAGARILIAEDNADMRDYLARILRPHWTIELAADGDAALVRARRARPDLILSDVMMPNLDGFGLLRELRADPQLGAIPVVLLSARAGEEAHVNGLQAGADDYLVKPFSARELLARVRLHLAGARARRQVEEQSRQLHQAKAEAERARALAEAASRSKDEFLAMLGHELRNPLSPILTALQVMRMRGAEGREQAMIERQVGHLVRLVDDLLDISRITRGKIELRKARTEMAQVVLQGLEIASPLLEHRRQEIDLDVEPQGLEVEVDLDRLAQVTANLLTNASKYSEPGTTVHVKASRAGGRVRLQVRDEGAGIAPEMLGKVFDVFFQQPQSLDRSKGGLGLGLAIVRSLVELHGGSVSAASAGLGRGSEFVVELPLAPGAAEPLPLGPPRAPAPQLAHGPGKRILIVDDNEDAAESIADLLRDLGNEIETAYDGPAALRIARVFKPEVCLVDIGLPAMDGYEVARKLRESSDLPRGARLIAVTGYGQDADRQRSREAGFDLHLVKPVNLDVLSDAVVN